MEKTLMMKKVILLILGIWDAVMAFLSPLWIAVAAICFSGRIHLLDESFNESLAGALGAVFLLLWIVVAVVPSAALFIGLRKRRAGIRCAAAVILAVMVLLCLLVCGWNPVDFLASL